MYQFNFNLSDTSPQEVLGVLKGTGSTDPDVIFAAMQDYRRTFAVQRVSGLIFMGVGAVSSLTILLIPISVPVAIFGWWYWRKGNRNLAVVETAYNTYVRPLGPGNAAVA